MAVLGRGVDMEREAIALIPRPGAGRGRRNVYLRRAIILLRERLGVGQTIKCNVSRLTLLFMVVVFELANHPTNSRDDI